MKECYDSFNDEHKKQIVQEVINYLCQYNRLPQDIEKDISDSLYSILVNKWKMIIEQDQEIIDSIFIKYFLEFPREELLAFLDNFKGQFHSKARRLKLLNGKVQFVEVETHQIARNIQRMNE